MPRESTPIRSWPARLWPLAYVVAVSVGLTHWFRHSYSDDAFVTYRYAQHLAQGHGFVFSWTAAPLGRGAVTALFVPPDDRGPLGVVLRHFRVETILPARDYGIVSDLQIRSCHFL